MDWLKEQIAIGKTWKKKEVVEDGRSNRGLKHHESLQRQWKEQDKVRRKGMEKETT